MLSIPGIHFASLLSAEYKSCHRALDARVQEHNAKLAAFAAELAALADETAWDGAAATAATQALPGERLDLDLRELLLLRAVRELLEAAEEERPAIYSAASAAHEAAKEKVRQGLLDLGFHDLLPDGTPLPGSYPPGAIQRHPAVREAEYHQNSMSSTLRASIRAVTETIARLEEKISESRRRALNALSV